MSMIISTIDRSPLPNFSVIKSMLASMYSENALRVVPIQPGGEKADKYRIYVHPSPESADEPPFAYVSLEPGLSSLDGLPGQNLRIATAVRAAMPANAPRTVLIDPDANAFVDLTPDITPEQIAAGWRDVSEGGFE